MTSVLLSTTSMTKPSQSELRVIRNHCWSAAQFNQSCPRRCLNTRVTHTHTPVSRGTEPQHCWLLRDTCGLRGHQRGTTRGESGTLADTADVWDTGIRTEGPHHDYLNTSRWSLLLLLLLPIVAGTANNILNLDSTSRWSKWSPRSDKTTVGLLHLFHRIYSCQLSNHIKCWSF